MAVSWPGPGRPLRSASHRSQRSQRGRIPPAPPGRSPTRARRHPRPRPTARFAADRSAEGPPCLDGSRAVPYSHRDAHPIPRNRSPRDRARRARPRPPPAAPPAPAPRTQAPSPAPQTSSEMDTPPGCSTGSPVFASSSQLAVTKRDSGRRGPPHDAIRDHATRRRPAIFRRRNPPSRGGATWKRVCERVAFVYPKKLQVCAYTRCFCVDSPLRSSCRVATDTLLPSAMAASRWHTCLAS
jgi:hypothetical protein